MLNPITPSSIYPLATVVEAALAGTAGLERDTDIAGGDVHYFWTFPVGPDGNGAFISIATSDGSDVYLVVDIREDLGHGEPIDAGMTIAVTNPTAGVAISVIQLAAYAGPGAQMTTAHRPLV